MARLPRPGSDTGEWGEILNDFLQQVHNIDGTLKSDSVPGVALQDSAISEIKLDTALRTKLNASGSGNPSLGGDLSGTTSNAQIVTGAVTNAKVAAGIAQSKIAGLTADLAAKASDDTVVKLSGAQTVDGIKTFSSSPSVPTPTNLSDATPKGYVDGLAVNSLSDVTVSNVSSGQVLKYNGTQWINDTATAGAGGYGPNWVASSNAPAAIKTAVANGGGTVATGSNDNVVIAAALTNYKAVYLTEGTFSIASTITLPQGRSLFGSGQKATELIGTSGLATSFISITSDHCAVARMTLTGAGGSSADGILAAVTSDAGFTTGSDACTNLFELTLRNIGGRGIVMTGSFNRDSKLYNIHVWDAVGDGYYISCPDGTMNQCIAGTCGGNGFTFINSSNWRVSSSKAWYSDGDGWLLGVNCTRSIFMGIEGQDNALAGIRVNGNLLTIEGFTADSNSYEGTTNDNIYSGLEIGLNPDGTSTGGFDITVVGGQAWDKSESGRGYKQRSGVRLRSGIRRLALIGVNTGTTTGTHYNVTAGIEFNTAADLTNASNAVFALNHGTVISNANQSTTVSSYAANKNTSAQEVVVTGTTLTDDAILQVTVPGGNVRYSFEGMIFYRADSTQHAKLAVVPSVVAGSGSVDGNLMYTFTDPAGADQIESKYLSGTPNPVTVQGASVNTAASVTNSEIRAVRISGTVYAGTTVTSAKFAVRVSESNATGTGIKIIAGSRLKVDVLS